MAKVREAEEKDIIRLTELFEGYRKFYKKDPDKAGAENFLRERLSQKDSVIYICEDDHGTPAGFTQLYPLFSSTRMKRLWLLNDLYVEEDHRGKGYSRILIERAKQLSRDTGAAGLMLQTAKTNMPGNALYPSEGFVLDEEFNTYNWDVE